MGSVSWYGPITAMSSEIEVTGIVEDCHNSESEKEAFEEGWLMVDGNVARWCVIFEDIYLPEPIPTDRQRRSESGSNLKHGDLSSDAITLWLPLSVDLRMLTPAMILFVVTVREITFSMVLFYALFNTN